MDWDEFAGRLLNVLLLAEERTFIVIFEEAFEGLEWRVQFSISEDLLIGQCNARLVFAKSSESAELVDRQLRGLGWAPTLEIDVPYWQQEIPLPAMTAEVNALVKASVGVMRDLFNMPSPDRLVYRSWREAEYFPDGFYTARQFEERDRGENPLPLKLGIRMLPPEA